MADFTVKDQSFKSGKIDVFKQVHVLRRIGPFVPDFMLIYKGMENGISSIDVMTIMGPKMIETFAKMSDEDVSYVMNACLETVQVQQGGMVWANIFSNGRMMFQNIDLYMIGYICWIVLEDNFKGFFLDLKGQLPDTKIAAESNG